MLLINYNTGGADAGGDARGRAGVRHERGRALLRAQRHLPRRHRAGRARRRRGAHQREHRQDGLVSGLVST